MPSLSKDVALLLFCCFRQADRSVHYALSCPTQWLQFVAYYDEVNKKRVVDAIRLLKEAGAETRSFNWNEVEQVSGWLEIPRLLLDYVSNPLKRSWSFSVEQLSIFSMTLEHLLRVLDASERGDNKQLIELRHACFRCHYLIGRKLVGLPEIRKADAIEHFNQSDFIPHVTFADMGIRSC